MSLLPTASTSSPRRPAVGIQVVGYGRFTSYQYPGGLNLNLITDPPPRPEPPR